MKGTQCTLLSNLDLLLTSINLVCVKNMCTTLLKKKEHEQRADGRGGECVQGEKDKGILCLETPQLTRLTG